MAPGEHTKHVELVKVEADQDQILEELELLAESTVKMDSSTSGMFMSRFFLDIC